MMVYALFLMVMLSFVVGVCVLQARIHSVRMGSVDPAYFSLMGEDGDYKVSERVLVTARCFNNLFEVPILFYTVAVIYIALDLETMLAVVFAYLFVAARVFQAYIHLTTNTIKLRMYAFLSSLVCIAVLWIHLLWLLG